MWDYVLNLGGSEAKPHGWCQNWIEGRTLSWCPLGCWRSIFLIWYADRKNPTHSVTEAFCMMRAHKETEGFAFSHIATFLNEMNQGSHAYYGGWGQPELHGKTLSEEQSKTETKQISLCQNMIPHTGAFPPTMVHSSRQKKERRKEHN